MNFQSIKFSPHMNFQPIKISTQINIQSIKFSAHMNFQPIKFSAHMNFQPIKFSVHPHIYKHSCSRVFTNGLGDRGSILGRVIPKTQKMVLDAILLNTQHYKVRIKGEVEQSKWMNGVTPSPIPWCCSYWKWSLRVTLN